MWQTMIFSVTVKTRDALAGRKKWVHCVRLDSGRTRSFFKRLNQPLCRIVDFNHTKYHSGSFALLFFPSFISLRSPLKTTMPAIRFSVVMYLLHLPPISFHLWLVNLSMPYLIIFIMVEHGDFSYSFSYLLLLLFRFFLPSEKARAHAFFCFRRRRQHQDI